MEDPKSNNNQNMQWLILSQNPVSWVTKVQVKPLAISISIYIHEEESVGLWRVRGSPGTPTHNIGEIILHAPANKRDDNNTM